MTSQEQTNPQPKGSQPDAGTVDMRRLDDSRRAWQELTGGGDSAHGEFEWASEFTRADPIEAGMCFRDYRLIKEIGRGGSSVVWEAQQVSLRRPVAIKFLAPCTGSLNESLVRFEREARAGGRLMHEGIVQTYAFGETNGLRFIVQEVVPGGQTLQSTLLEIGRGDLGDPYFGKVISLFRKIADALQFAHENKVIHRDIKPGNILINQRNEPRIVDFGLAKMEEDDLDVTRTGQIMGTPFYMSPEQASGHLRSVDCRTDIFSLGATLYECLTLSRPFNGESSQDVLLEIMHRDPVSPSEQCSVVPRELSAICLKAMSKAPEERYQTMQSFSEDLRRFENHQPVLARPPSRVQILKRWVRRHPTLASTTVMSVLLLVTVTALLIMMNEGGTDRDNTGVEFQNGSAVESNSYETALAIHTTRETGTDWRVVRVVSGKFIFKTTSSHDLTVDALDAGLSSLLEEFEDTWDIGPARTLPVVRVCSRTSDYDALSIDGLAGASCRFESRRGELIVDGSESAESVLRSPELPFELFLQFLYSTQGHIEPHPWFQSGFRSFYSLGSLDTSEEAGGERLAQTLEAGLVALPELLNASSDQWSGKASEAWDLQAWSFASMLLGDRPTSSEGLPAHAAAKDALGQYVIRLGIGFDLALNTGDQIADLSPSRRRQIRSEAFEASWGLVDLNGVERSWRTYLLDL